MLLPESVHIYVDQECIDKGKIGMATLCPVALACQKYLPADSVGFVGPLSMVIGNLTVKSPEAVKNFIMAFDKYLAVEPFEFDLDLTDSFKGYNTH